MSIATLPQSDRRGLTVEQVALRFGVKRHVVLGFIRSGELRAIDLRAKLVSSKKPRWKILIDDLEAFEHRRASKPEPAAPSRRSSPASAAQAEPVGKRW